MGTEFTKRFSNATLTPAYTTLVMVYLKIVAQRLWHWHSSVQLESLPVPQLRFQHSLPSFQTLHLLQELRMTIVERTVQRLDLYSKMHRLIRQGN